jgi:3-oxoacyl-[acyl-carrier protein] reductase
MIIRMTRNLRDMNLVITGASAGIGKVLAESLAGAGARLVLAARRMDRLEELRGKLGERHLCIRADVSKREDCQMLIARAVEHFGRIDTLVCNAGYGSLRAVHETSADDFQAIFQTNVFGTTDCIRAAVPVMLKQDLCEGLRGQIMIISSAAARRGLPYAGAYSATKAAQLSLAEALRVELLPQRIAVTSVHPIGTQTEFFQVAEESSRRRITEPGRGGHRHSAERVVRGMIRAIEKPKREVWSSPLSRVLLAINALIPSLGDRAMAKERAEFERINQIPTS